MEGSSVEDREAFVTLMEKRVLSIVEGCFVSYGLPVEYHMLCGRFNRLARNHKIHFEDVLQDMVARGVLRLHTLPTTKHLVFTRRQWDSLTENQQTELMDRLLVLYVRKGSRYAKRLNEAFGEKLGEPLKLPRFFKTV